MGCHMHFWWAPGEESLVPHCLGLSVCHIQSPKVPRGQKTGEGRWWKFWGRRSSFKWPGCALSLLSLSFATPCNSDPCLPLFILCSETLLLPSLSGLSSPSLRAWVSNLGSHSRWISWVVSLLPTPSYMISPHTSEMYSLLSPGCPYMLLLQISPSQRWHHHPPSLLSQSTGNLSWLSPLLSVTAFTWFHLLRISQISSAFLFTSLPLSCSSLTYTIAVAQRIVLIHSPHSPILSPHGSLNAPSITNLITSLSFLKTFSSPSLFRLFIAAWKYYSKI